MICKLSDICILTTGKNIDKKHLCPSGTPYITGASCIQQGVVETTSFVDVGKIKQPGIAHNGDIIISRVGTLGKIGILKLKDACLSAHVIALTPKINIDITYLLAMLITGLTQIETEEECDKIGFSVKLDPAEIMKLQIEVPEINEQKYLVMSLVRWALVSCAVRLQHIKTTEIKSSISLLEDMTSHVRNNVRNQCGNIDELKEEIMKCPFAENMEENDPEHVFQQMWDIKSQNNKLVKVL